MYALLTYSFGSNCACDYFLKDSAESNAGTYKLPLTFLKQTNILYSGNTLRAFPVGNHFFAQGPIEYSGNGARSLDDLISKIMK